MHQESVSTIIDERAKIDHQPSQKSSSARNDPSSECGEDSSDTELTIVASGLSKLTLFYTSISRALVAWSVAAVSYTHLTLPTNAEV